MVCFRSFFNQPPGFEDKTNPHASPSKKWYRVAILVGSTVTVLLGGLGVCGLLQTYGLVNFSHALPGLAHAIGTIGHSSAFWSMAFGGIGIGGYLIGWGIYKLKFTTPALKSNIIPQPATIAPIAHVQSAAPPPSASNTTAPSKPKGPQGPLRSYRRTSTASASPPPQLLAQAANPPVLATTSAPFKPTLRTAASSRSSPLSASKASAAAAPAIRTQLPSIQEAFTTHNFTLSFRTEDQIERINELLKPGQYAVLHYFNADLDTYRILVRRPPSRPNHPLPLLESTNEMTIMPEKTKQEQKFYRDKRELFSVPPQTRYLSLTELNTFTQKFQQELAAAGYTEITITEKQEPYSISLERFLR
ncbi:MAG: hypothetical protein JSS62_00700 [Verrucomicrobia bacterium]|nr:hypothetical protein [Verrucomicrobiota bacterium]MBS0645969.1 hypothetical protein [Verrucomicrobiota bacterium]